MSRARRLAGSFLRRWLAPAVAALLVVGGLHQLEKWSQLQGWALYSMAGRTRSVSPRPDPRIVIVAIDEATLADRRIPKWGSGGLNRSAHARLVRQLRD